MSYFMFPDETQDAFLFFTLCATSRPHLILLDVMMMMLMILFSFIHFKDKLYIIV